MKPTNSGNLTEGSILKKLLLVALPIMGSQLLQMAYNLVDMFWLGRLGDGGQAVAASGTAGMFMWLASGLMVIGRVGADIGVAQGLGRGEVAEAKAYAQGALTLSLVTGLIYTAALLIFHRPFVGFFNIQSQAVIDMTEGYLLIVALALPLEFMSGTFIGTFNASGHSEIPFVINIFCILLNVVLDPIFILTLGWGVLGAALATILAQALSFTLLLLAFLFHKKRPFDSFRFFVRPKAAVLRQIIRWSIPVTLESVYFCLIGMVTSRFVAGYGTEAMSVSRIGSQIESITWLVGGGFAQAMTAFTGQNCGAGRWTRIHKSFRLSLLLMSLYGLCVSVALYFGGGALFAVFINDDVIISMGAGYMHILALCQVMQCWEGVAGGVFKGTGRTLPPSVVSISSNTLRVFLCYALMNTSLGLQGIWWGICATAMMRGSFCLIWYLIAQRRMPHKDTALPAAAVSAVE